MEKALCGALPCTTMSTRVLLRCSRGSRTSSHSKRISIPFLSFTSFSQSARCALAAPSTPISDLKVNQDRLWRDIHHNCQWGQGERWGEYVRVLLLRFALLNSRSTLGNSFLQTMEKDLFQKEDELWGIQLCWRQLTTMRKIYCALQSP